MPDITICEDDAVCEVIDAALMELWNTANTLSAIRPRRPKHYRVTIFGSARLRPEDPLYADVKELSRRLSAIGCDIVSGGGPGLMQAANEGENLGDPENRTLSIGVRVELPFEQGVNRFVEKAFVHRTFFTRLHHFMTLGTAFVVVDGGIGTALETLMIWQLLQVKLVEDVPLIFVGPMWRGLVEWARAFMIDRDPPLCNAADLDLPRCVDTVEEAAALIEAHKARTFG
jgi:uncharacterized protein (TIGR00730 family)